MLNNDSFWTDFGRIFVVQAKLSVGEDLGEFSL